MKAAIRPRAEDPLEELRLLLEETKQNVGVSVRFSACAAVVGSAALILTVALHQNELRPYVANLPQIAPALVGFTTVGTVVVRFIAKGVSL